MTAEYTVQFNTEPHLSLSFNAAEPEQVVVSPSARPLTYSYNAKEVDGEIVFGAYVEPYAEEGELRLYGKDGQFTTIPWSAGLMMLCGDKTIKGVYDLNTETNVGYVFRERNDLELPDGLTFANATGWAYTFYNCKRLSLPTTITLRGNCNSTFRSCTMTSSHRIYWEDATTLPCAFGYSGLVSQIGGPDIIADCPNVTDLR